MHWIKNYVRQVPLLYYKIWEKALVGLQKSLLRLFKTIGNA